VTLSRSAGVASHQEQLERLRQEVESLRGELRRAEKWTARGGETERLRAELRSLRAQLRQGQRLASLGTMLAMVAHEFNNILTPVINYAQLARNNSTLTDKALTKAVEGGQRAAEICRAILGMARAEAPAEPEEVAVATLVSETLRVMARDPRRDGIEVVYRGPADLTAKTRKIELQQVLLNLLLNARQAVLEKDGPRRIEIGADRCTDGLVLRVCDNGPGIAPGDLKHLFRPYFTTRSETEGEPGGHGLGLAVCREIVQSMGGTITAAGGTGCGATFTICLPQ